MGEFTETQTKPGHPHGRDSNRGPKDNGSRPTEMPEQPHAGTLCHYESNPGKSRGGSMPEPIESHGMKKQRG